MLFANSSRSPWQGSGKKFEAAASPRRQAPPGEAPSGIHRRPPPPSRAFWALLVWSGTVAGSYCAFLSCYSRHSDGTAASSRDHGIRSVLARTRSDAAGAALLGRRPSRRAEETAVEAGDAAAAEAEAAAAERSLPTDARSGGAGAAPAAAAASEEGRREKGERNDNAPAPAAAPVKGIRLDDSWTSAGDARPLWVTVASKPRYDLLGAFLAPSVYLLAVAHRYGWAVEILPFGGSDAERTLRHLLSLGSKIDRAFGSGFADASNRKDYDPSKLNRDAHANFGVLPEQPERHLDLGEWTVMEQIPRPGPELDALCRKNVVPGNGYLRCHLLLPLVLKDGQQNTNIIINHIVKNGGPGRFFTPSFRKWMRSRFMERNGHRLKHFDSSKYSVAVHVRRGDVLDPHRWIDQSAYAAVARRVCRDHPGADAHVFSSGKNRDGDWKVMEGIVDVCGSVSFHLDEYEFDTLAHLVAADALIISRSTFSYVPALMNEGDVYFPTIFGHLRLPHWHLYRAEDGSDVQP